MDDSPPTPLIHVSHLPSASSFYASLTQPLGLQFLSAAPISPATIHFGILISSASGPRNSTVFSITQSPSTSPRLSHITLSAPSPKAVKEFWAKSQVLQRGLSLEQQEGAFFEIGRENEYGTEDRAMIRDFDGNVVEAVYMQRGNGNGRSRAVLPAIETASTEKEARRVLQWQEDVARSISGSGDGEDSERRGLRRADTMPLPERERPRLLRRETVTTEHYQGPPPSAPGDGGIGKAVLGTALGAVTGAFLAYSLMRSESPPPARRVSAPTYTTPTPIVMEDRERDRERVVKVPARSYVSDRDAGARGGTRYIQYTAALPMRPPPQQQQDIRRIEERSHVSARSKRSNYENERGQLAILPPAPSTTSTRDRERERAAEEKSHISTRSHKSERRKERSSSGSASGSGVSEQRRRRSSPRERGGDRDRDRETYISARSHRSDRSESTVLPPAPAPPSAVSTTKIRVVPQTQSHISHHSRHSHHPSPSPQSSHYHTSPSIHSARHIPLPESTISLSPSERARGVPLPRSMVSGRGYESGGYAESVAPSDSVSSVGMKRERERLGERMRVRGLGGDLREMGRWGS